MNQSERFQLSDLNSLLSTIELASFLRRKPQTIRMWLHYDRLPVGLARPIKINNRNYWRESDVRNYLETLTSDSIKCR